MASNSTVRVSSRGAEWRLLQTQTNPLHESSSSSSRNGNSQQNILVIVIAAILLFVSKAPPPAAASRRYLLLLPALTLSTSITNTYVCYAAEESVLSGYNGTVMAYGQNRASRRDILASTTRGSDIVEVSYLQGQKHVGKPVLIIQLKEYRNGMVPHWFEVPILVYVRRSVNQKAEDETTSEEKRMSKSSARTSLIITIGPSGQHHAETTSNNHVWATGNGNSEHGED
ncbi:hypothetical protein NC651_025920 [Populus alba x Populus x berolinensis]|nr:hypothetical protein NC651_025920 [Populus alba x Populus x berolinensis]